MKLSERQLKSWERQKLVTPTPSYGFKELLALRTLIQFRRSRVTPLQIRRALAALVLKLRDVADPLTQLKIFIDGKRIRVEIDGGAMEAESGQLVLNFDQQELSRLLEFKAPEDPTAERTRRASAEGWFQRGLELEQTGAPAEQVIEAYHKALEFDPKSAGALVNLGTIHFNARGWKEAERHYLLALEADPGVFAGALRSGEFVRRARRSRQGGASLRRGAPRFTQLRRRTLQPGASVSGIQPDHEGGPALDRVFEAGPVQPLGQPSPGGS